MHWSVTLVFVAALGANAPQATTEQFDSYSKAYWVASESHRPMLVILTDGNAEQGTSLEVLQQNETSREVLGDYVVAVIDTRTEHGKKVHELFGAPGPTQRAAELTAPILGLFGGADEGISPEIVATFGEALTAAGAEHEFVTYPGAPHGFFDQGLAGYEEACADAWRRVTDFIAARGGGR